MSLISLGCCSQLSRFETPKERLKQNARFANSVNVGMDNATDMGAQWGYGVLLLRDSYSAEI
jgi:hypothetical protein